MFLCTTNHRSAICLLNQILHANTAQFGHKNCNTVKNSQLTQAGTPAQLLGMIRKQFDENDAHVSALWK